MPGKSKKRASALDVIARLLTRRDHTRGELTKKLVARGYDSAEITEALDRARELHFMQDDSVVAQRYAESLARRPSATPKWVRAKLLARGVSPDLSADCVARVFEGWDPKARALDLVRNEARKDRAARKLQRRGFSSEVIGWVLGQLPND